MTRPQTILLTGATGFVGRHLYSALLRAGHRVRCTSRNPDRARARHPDREWVRLDADQPASFPAALRNCNAAYYLVHAIGEGRDYPEREARAARAFRGAVADAGLQRIIYLGGVAPRGRGSRHLRSRLETGELLRRGPVPTVELRAGMIIGRGGSSWQMVRDLAARLPAMLLPRWLHNHSWPVDIEDVVFALVSALSIPADASGWYDVPGPERLSHRELLGQVAEQLGHHPVMVGVPVLSPRLSSYWIAAVTRADLGLAQELVEGLRTDLDPSGSLFWDLFPSHERVPLGTSIRKALEDPCPAGM